MELWYRQLAQKGNRYTDHLLLFLLSSFTVLSHRVLVVLRRNRPLSSVFELFPQQTAKKPPKKPSDVDSWADKRHPTAPDRNAVEKRTAPQLSQTMPLPSKLVTESADALSLGGEGSGNSENEEKSVRRKVFMTAVEGLSEEERDARHEAFTLSDEQRLSDLDIFIVRSDLVPIEY